MNDTTTINDRLIYASGVMAEQIRHFDWAKTSLGSIDDWPASLRFAVNQMLDSAFPMLLWWGEENIQLFNDAGLRLQKNNPVFTSFQALGRPAHLAWPELWPLVQQKKELIFSTGKAVFTENKLIVIPGIQGPEEVYWTYSFDPLRDDQGLFAGLLAIFKESTVVHRQLQQKEQEQAFLLKLSDQLRTWSSPEQIETGGAAMIAAHLNADRVGFAEAHDDKQLTTIQRSFVKEGLSDLAGTYNYSDFGSSLYAALKNGDMVVKSDIATDDMLDLKQKAAHKALQLGATVNLPLIKSGRLLAVLFVHFRDAHHWSAHELSLLEQSAGRIWDAILAARAEQALVQSEEQYRILFNSIDDAFMVIEFLFAADGGPLDYRFLLTNPAFERQTGLQDVRGKTILEIMPGVERTWIEMYGKVARSGQPLRFEEYNKGTAGWYDVYAVAVASTHNQVVVVFHDITERKLEEQRKNDFLSMASHELKTPLTSVAGYLHILKSSFVKNRDIDIVGILERTAKQVSKMTTIINSFLNIDRFDLGRLTIERKLFDMVEVIRDAKEEALINTISHRFEFEPIDPAFVEADKDKIIQVIENFISNAVKYSPLNSLITLSCIRDNNHVKVSVKDEGIGLSESDKTQVFDRFYRVENDQVPLVAGFGIGLYICKEIIELHGGTIGVESKTNSGSIFWFSLPLLSAD